LSIADVPANTSSCFAFIACDGDEASHVAGEEVQCACITGREKASAILQDAVKRCGTLQNGWAIGRKRSQGKMRHLFFRTGRAPAAVDGGWRNRMNKQ